MRLADKKAIVTDVATALRLAEEGADLCVCDLHQEGLDSVAAQAQALGRLVLAMRGSVADRAFVQEIVRCTLAELGGLDILVNNAGIVRDVIGHKMTEEQWDLVIGVNLKGVFNYLQACMLPMRQQSSGAIVNLSLLSRYGVAGQFNYAAAPGTIDIEMLLTMPQAKRKMLQKLVIPLERLGQPRGRWLT